MRRSSILTLNRGISMHDSYGMRQVTKRSISFFSGFLRYCFTTVLLNVFVLCTLHMANRFDTLMVVGRALRQLNNDGRTLGTSFKERAVLADYYTEKYLTEKEYGISCRGFYVDKFGDKKENYTLLFYDETVQKFQVSANCVPRNRWSS